MAWTKGLNSPGKYGDSRKAKGRIRTTFTRQQLDILEHEFTKSEHPDMAVRETLAEKLDLNTNQVSIWFKNRRARAKKNIGYRRPGGSEEDDDIPDTDDEDSNGALGSDSSYSTNSRHNVGNMFSYNQQQSRSLTPSTYNPSVHPSTSPANDKQPDLSQLRFSYHASPFSQGEITNLQLTPNKTAPNAVQPNIPTQPYYHNAHFQFSNNAVNASPILHQQLLLNNGAMQNGITHIGTAGVAQSMANHMAALFQASDPLSQSSYPPERQFFGNKFVTQIIHDEAHQEYKGGMEPIFYASEDDLPISRGMSRVVDTGCA